MLDYANGVLPKIVIAASQFSMIEGPLCDARKILFEELFLFFFTPHRFPNTNKNTFVVP